MTTGNGYIALYRKLLNNPVVCKDADHLAVWIWLLLNAVWDKKDVTFGGERITLNGGQLTTGRKVIASELKISESKVQRILKRFESEHQIEQRTDRQCRLITIVSWEEYQDSEQQIEHQVNNERTTSEQRVNTNKESNKDNKGINNNISSKLHTEFEALWKLYPKKQGGKDKAYGYYERARRNGTTYEEVEKGIEAYKDYLKANEVGIQFVKQGTTFFSQKAWGDDWSIRNGRQEKDIHRPNNASRSAAERRGNPERIPQGEKTVFRFKEA